MRILKTAMLLSVAVLPAKNFGQATSEKILGCWTLTDMQFLTPNEFSAKNRSDALNTTVCFLPGGTFSASLPDGHIQTGHYDLSGDGKTLSQTRDNAVEGLDDDALILLLDGTELRLRSGGVTLYFTRQDTRTGRHSLFYLKDRLTGKAIPYADVWLDENTPVTTDSIGGFTIDPKYIGRPTKINALGYRHFEGIFSGDTEILLEPDMTMLAEVVVKKPARGKKVKLGKTSGNDVFMVCGRESIAPFNAQYFGGVDGAHVMSKVRFKAFASHPGRTVGVYICGVSADGSPGAMLTNEPQICSLKKGMHVNEIDLRELGIPFPETGAFVLIHYIFSENNREYGPNQTSWFFYEPGLPAREAGEQANRWHCDLHGWHRDTRYDLCMQLILE